MMIKHSPIKYFFNKVAEHINSDEGRKEWDKLASEEKDKILEEFINRIK